MGFFGVVEEGRERAMGPCAQKGPTGLIYELSRSEVVGWAPAAGDFDREAWHSIF